MVDFFIPQASYRPPTPNRNKATMAESLYLTATEAAAELNVSVSTLYAYVSRNRIRSTPTPGRPNSRTRRYWRADVERLKTGTPGTTENILASDTKITLLTKEGLFYRGQSVNALAESSTLETVAALLWNVDEEVIFTENLPSLPQGYKTMHRLAQKLPVTEQALVLLPFIEHSNPRSYDLSPVGFAKTGADVLRLYAATLCRASAPSSIPIHEFLAEELSAPAGFDDIIRRLLVLLADHELDPSTYAVRAMGNTGVTPYQALIAGLMSFYGRRLWAGPTEATSRLLDEIFQEDDPATPILRRFRSGEPLPGFEAGLHEIQDPRPEHLLRVLNKLLREDEEFERLKVAISTARELAGVSPHLMLPTMFISRKLGLKGSDIALGTLGRAAGWIAHASEQYHEHQLIRPHADYVGDLPEKSTNS